MTRLTAIIFFIFLPFTLFSADMASWKNLYDETRDLYYKGKFSEALAMANNASKEALSFFPEKHPNIGATMNLRAMIFNKLGMYTDAAKDYEKAIIIYKEYYGERNINVGNLLDNLGDIYAKQSKFNEADKLFLEAKDILADTVGENHEDYAIILTHMAQSFMLQGRYGEAEPLIKQTLQILKKIHGEKHIFYGEAIASLANLYYFKGDYKKAEKEYMNALNTKEAALKTKVHPSYATTLKRLGILYHTQKKYQNAEQNCGMAMKIYEAFYGKNHPEVADAMIQLSEIYEDINAVDQAEQLLTDAHKIKKSVLGPYDADIIGVSDKLGKFYLRYSKEKLAEPLYSDILVAVDSAFKDGETPAQAAAYNAVAEYYISINNYPEAEKYLKLAVDIYTNLGLNSHPAYATTIANKATIAFNKGEFTTAQSIFEQSLEIKQQKLGDMHPDLLTILESLEKCYQQTGNEKGLKQVESRMKKIHDLYKI